MYMMEQETGRGSAVAGRREAGTHRQAPALSHDAELPHLLSAVQTGNRGILTVALINASPPWADGRGTGLQPDQP